MKAVRFPILKTFDITNVSVLEEMLKGVENNIKENFGLNVYKEHLKNKVKESIEKGILNDYYDSVTINEIKDIINAGEERNYIKVKNTPLVRSSKIKKAFESYKGQRDIKGEGDWNVYVAALQTVDNAEFSKGLKEKLKEKSLLFSLNDKDVFVPANTSEQKTGLYKRVVAVAYPRNSKKGFFLQDIDKLLILADGSRKLFQSQQFAFSLSYTGDLHNNSFSRKNVFEYEFAGYIEPTEISPVFALIVKS